MPLPLKVGLVYNEPIIDRYTQMGEADAIADVLEEVTAVNKALLEMGHHVTKLGLVPPLEESRRLVQELPVDIYFNLFEFADFLTGIFGVDIAGDDGRGKEVLYQGMRSAADQ